MRVGLAMLQGARHEHAEALRAASKQLDIEIEVVELRSAGEVDGHLDCLVLPGGESTATVSYTHLTLPTIYSV